VNEQKQTRERGRGRLYKQPGSANWWLAFYKHGKQIRMSTEETDETAALRALKRKLQERDAELGGGKKMLTPAQLRVTVSELLDALKVDFTVRGKLNNRVLSNLKPMYAWFGFCRASELTSAEIDKFVAHAQVHGRHKTPTKPVGRHAGKPIADKPSKPSSINRSLQLLTQAYKLAIENGLLNTAPKIRKLSEIGNARQGFFSPMEFRSVLSNLPQYTRDFVLFCYLTGWRRGEVKSLCWQDVDAETIRLRAENAKNRTGRSVPLVGELSEVIARRRAEMSTETALIFHHSGQPVGDFRKAWASACKLAGVSGKLVHDLRRTAVRDMVRSGVSQTVAMSISGHKTVSMFQRYSITSDTDQKQALEARAEYISKQEQVAQAITPSTDKVQ
jgi:site-specific recombinase XerD